MNFVKATATLFVFLLLFCSGVSAQQLTEAHPPVNSHGIKHFRCSLVMDHTYIGTETKKGKEYLVVPSIGLVAEYWFNGKWGLGLHNDLELVTVEVQREGEKQLDRNMPLLFTLDGLWKPSKHLVFLFGPGIEMEEHENLFVLRGGLEYEIELKSHWDISPTIFYDTRLHAYDTFSVGIGIGKRF